MGLSPNSTPAQTVSDYLLRETLYLLLQQVIGAGAPVLMIPVDLLKMVLSAAIGARLFVKYALLLTAIPLGARLARQSWEHAT
jgi:hypothetical protein